MANQELCHCTATHFCEGVDNSVLNVIAQEANQSIGEVESQSFNGSSRAEVAGGSGFTRISAPAQEAYRRLLKKKVLKIPARSHAVLLDKGSVQPVGSEVGPVRPQA